MKTTTTYSIPKKSITGFFNNIKINSGVLSLLFVLFFAGEGIGQIAQRGSATTGFSSTTSSNSPGTTFTINKPTGVVSGDVMFASIATDPNNTTTWNDPTITGWTKITTTQNSQYAKVTLLYRVADGTEGASFTVTVYGNTGGTGATSGSIVAFSGVNTTGGSGVAGVGTGPFDNSTGTFTFGSSTSISPSSITTSSNNSAILFFSLVAGDGLTHDSWSTTSPASLTEIVDYLGGGDYSSVGVAWGLKATAGATGNGSVTLTSGSAFTYPYGILISLKSGPYITASSTTVFSAPISTFKGCLSQATNPQGVAVNGYYLTANMTVTPPSGFEISTSSSSGFSTSPITLTPSSGTVSQTIYVRMASGSAGSYSGNITCASTGATTQNIAVSGTVSGVCPNIALANNGSQPAAANIVKGSTNNILYTFSTAVTSTDTTINQVDFTTTGSAVTTTDLTNIKLWYNTSNSFTSASLLSTLTTSLSAGSKSFASLTQTISSGSTGYFWITADIASGATTSNTIAVSAITTDNLWFSNGGILSGSASAGNTQTIIASTIWYSATSGTPDATDVNQWWSANNSTGSHPPNFTTAGYVFIIQNGCTMKPLSTWTGNSGSFIQINATGALDLNNKTLSSWGSIKIGGTGVASGGAITSSNATASSCSIPIELTLASTIKSTSGAITLSGPINLSSYALTTNCTNAITLSGTIYGTGSIVKSGTSSLTISGNNTFSGGVTYTNTSSGNINIGHANALGSGTFVISGNTFDNSSGGALTITNPLTISCGATGTTFTGTNNLTQSSGAVAITTATAQITIAANTLCLTGNISGSSLGMTKLGTGTMILSGENTFTGTLTVSAGTLKLGANGTSPNGPLGTTGGATSVSSGAVLDLNGYTLATAEGLTLNGTGLTASPAGALTNTGGNASYSGAIILGSAATITATTSGTLTCSGAVTGAGLALTLDGAVNSSGTMSGVIGTTSGTVTKNGAGTWTLSGANTFTGNTTVAAGTLKLGVSSTSNTSGPLGTIAGLTSVTSGAVLDMNGFSLTSSATEPLTLNGTGLSSAAAGALTNTGGNATFSGAITLGASGATITATTSGTLTCSGNVTGNTYALTLDGASGSTGTMSGAVMTTSGTVTKNGAGTWTFGNVASSYTGLTTVSDGTLKIGAGSTANTGGPLGTPTSGTTVSSGASLDMNGFSLSASATEALTINGTGVSNVGALTNSSTTAVTYIGTVALGDNTNNYIGTSGNATTGTLTVSGIISGASKPLQIVNTGATPSSVIITAASSHSGATTISSGTLKLSGSGALGSTTSISVASAAIFDVSVPTTALTLSSTQIFSIPSTGANTTSTLTVASTKGLTLGSTGGITFSAYGGANGNSVTNAPLTVTGASAGALALNDAPITITTSSALSAGTYIIIAKASSATGVSGTPGALTMAGSGLASGYSGSLAVTSGQLVLTVVASSTITLASNTVAAASICAASTKVPLQSFSLAVTNATGNLTNVGFTTTGNYVQADITKYQLWYGSTNSIGSATQLGTDLASSGVAGGRTFTAFATPTLTSGTTYYFWITADVTSGVVDGNTIAVNAINTSDLTSTSIEAGSTSAGGTQTLKASPTTSNAGPDQTAAATCGLTQVTLAGNNPTVGTGAWSIISGTGGSFTSSSTYNTTFSGTAGSTYTLRWTVSNSPCTASTDDVVITFNQNPTTSNAGPDQTAAATCGLTQVTLAGNNPTVGTGAWSIVSGTGGSFTSSSTYNTTFSGTAGSTYTLRWTISNSPCTASTDDVVITFNRNPTTATNTSTQTICSSATANLSGNTATVGTGAWTVVSGPSTLSSQFSNTALATAVFTPAGGAGSYVVRWTISNSPCTASTADATITVSSNNTAGAASATPTVAINTALTNITHTTTGATGISSSGVSGGNGLPSGVSATWSGNLITISGTPTASGTFNYSITLTGGCGSVNATGTITVTATCTTNTWTGATSTAWATTTNWSCGIVPTSAHDVVIADVTNDPIISGDASVKSISVDAGGALTVNSGNTLTVTNLVTVASGGSLVFENTAGLLQTSTGANSGNIVYKRTTTTLANNYDFVYWGSPVASQTLGSIWMASNWSDTFYYFNASGNSWVGANASTVMTPGIGYISRSRNGQPGTDYNSVSTTFNTGGTWTAKFYGVPNNGTIPVPIVKTASTPYNLIANPYPSALDLVSFYTTNQSLITANFYFWTHGSAITNNNYSASDYGVYNASLDASVGSISTNRYVAAGQGFFTAASSSGTASFTNAHRISSASGQNSYFYRPAKKDLSGSGLIVSHKIWFNLVNSQTTAFKQQLLAYAEGATTGYDTDLDAVSFEGDPNFNFYSIITDKKLAIQSRPLPFNENDVVALGYKTTTAGTFQIKIDRMDGLFVNLNSVYLEDKVLNVIHDLKQGSYSFTSASGTFNDRFVIRYKGGTTPAAPLTKVQASQCGTTLAALNTAIVANSVTGATNYRFKVVNGASTQTIETVSSLFYLTSLTGGGLHSTAYTISVAIKINGVWGDYGDACTVTTPEPTTKVQASQCGTTLATLSTAIVANSVTGATNYRFNVVNGASTQTIESESSLFYLTSLTGGGLQSTAYTISVAIKINGVWGDYGDACTVTTPGPTTKVQATQCGTTLAALNTAIIANSVTGATNYRFKVVNGASNQIIETVSRWFYLTSLTGGAMSSTAYTISVSIKLNGIWGAYGDTCTVSTPALKTKVQASQCGTTLAALNTAIIANSVTGATNYRFKVVNGASTQTIETVSRWFYLTSLTGGGLYSTAYTISVAIKINGVWGDYGDACTVTTPAPNTKVQATQCGTTLAALNTAIVANSVTGATNYRFKVVNGASTQTIETVSRWFYLTSLTGGGLYSTAYTISVAIKINGVWGDYGDACTVTTPAPKTKVQATQCGTTLAALNTAIVANSITGATNYRFKVVNGTTTRYAEMANRWFYLTALAGSGLYSTAYTISVAVKYNGVWGDYGDACIVTTPSAPLTKPADLATVTELSTFTVTGHPNPYTNTFKLNITTQSNAVVNVMVYDVIGKLIEVRNSGVAELGTMEIGDRYATGVYNVIVTQGTDTKTVRMIKK